MGGRLIFDAHFLRSSSIFLLDRGGIQERFFFSQKTHAWKARTQGFSSAVTLLPAGEKLG